MFNWLWSRLRRNTSPTNKPSNAGSVAVMERYPTIEVMSAGTNTTKDALPIKWPTRAECLAARGRNTPVIFTVSFDGSDDTDIPVYVTSCVGPTDGTAFFVQGVTGLGRYGMGVSVAYDFPSMIWARNVNPDQPRQIMYKD
jgi:hypothetical protein